MVLAHVADDGRVLGVTTLSTWPGGEPYPVPDYARQNVEIANEHSILTEPHWYWRYDGQTLVRRSDHEIEQQRRQRQRPMHRPQVDKLLLNEINTLRTALGLPERTMEALLSTDTTKPPQEVAQHAEEAR